MCGDWRKWWQLTVIGLFFFATALFSPQSFAQYPPAKILSVSEIDNATVRTVLEYSLQYSEAIYAGMPKSQNPRRRLFRFFLETLREDIKTLRTQMDWNGNLSRLKLGSIGPLVSRQLSEASLRALASSAAAYGFVYRLAVYLNFNSILVEKDPAEIATALENLDHAMGRLRTKLESSWAGYRRTQHAVYVRGVRSLAGDVRAHYATVVLRKDSGVQARVHANIEIVLKEIFRLRQRTPVPNLKIWQALEVSPSYVSARRELRNIALPDSSDIDGADEAMERVLSVQIGFELLDQILRDAEGWMGNL